MFGTTEEFTESRSTPLVGGQVRENAQSSDDLDGDPLSMRCERFDVSPISGQNGSAQLSNRDNERIHCRAGASTPAQFSSASCGQFTDR